MSENRPLIQESDGRESIGVVNLTYAGIGSRRTPPEILGLMMRTADALWAQGYTLRTGHAPGADQAFEAGIPESWPHAEVYLPWPSYEAGAPINADVVIDHPSREARALAQHFHPAWDRLTSGGQALQARNSYQILGPNLSAEERSKFVLCWTPDASLDGHGPNTGGTGQALRLAVAYNVQVFNLARPDHRGRVERMIEYQGVAPKATVY